MVSAPQTPVPLDPPVPTLRLLGTSWYRRGVEYWVRRVWLLGVYLALLGGVLIVTGAIVWGVSTSFTGSSRIVLLALVAIAILASFISPVRSSRRRRRARQQGAAAPGQTRSTRASRSGGLGVGVAAYGGSVAAGALVTVSAVFIFGSVVVLVVDSAGRYLNNQEFFAVQAVTRWKQRHPSWNP